CLLNLLLTSDERAVYFAPAEVEFLFSGPFKRRQLLVYKMIAGLLSSLGLSLLVTFLFAHHAHSFLYAFAGLFLLVEFLVLISMAVGLLISTLGTLAFSRQRKIVVVVVVVVAGVAAAVLWPRGGDWMAQGPQEMFARVERSPLLNVLAWPLRP